MNLQVMWKLRSLFSLLLLSSAAVVSVSSSQRSNRTKWKTLTGDPPLVIARGGFSGLFPDSSSDAYKFALIVSLQNVIFWCDVQLSKDAVGFCLPDLLLDNSTTAASAQLFKQSTYLVNGVSVNGIFSIDYTFKQLKTLNLKQGVFSRTPKFDGNANPILSVQDVFSQLKPPGLWLNIEHDAFYSQHNLSIRNFIVNTSRTVIIDYISSPEVNFLTSIASRIKKSPTKLIFRFLRQQVIEPSTNQTYVSLLKNLTFIKTFASGILVPKDYIWPVDSNQYLLPSSTSLVLDAHKQGLEVYASEFANDANYANNFTYDPVAEYLSYIDNDRFSVDGVISDFPITPSQAIDCYSHTGKNDTVQAKLLIISSEGASGLYPGCTDLAYNQAILDGVDILDCPVQITQDGIPICLGSINLIDRTTAAQSPFVNVTMDVPDLNVKNGILAFNLTWSQIQTLQPLMYSPYSRKYSLYRNPAFRNAGKLVQLSDFLAIANASSVTGVVISIENAAYLAQNQGLNAVNTVLDTLNKSGFTSHTSKKVMIESTDSSVLKKIGRTSNYELVYRLDEDVSGITNSTIVDIKKFASSVIIGKKTVYDSVELFLTSATEVVPTLQSFNLSAYVQIFSNEFVSQAWDYLSDAYVEVNSFVYGMGIDGIVSGYPATSAKYRRNRCLGYKVTPTYMQPVGPGNLIGLMSQVYMPPSEAPKPILTEADVDEPPLPAVIMRPPPTGNETTTTTIAPGPSSKKNGQEIVFASTLFSSLAVFMAFMVLNL